MKVKKKIVIGSRGSNLALWQSEFVRKKLLEAYPDQSFEIKTIKTTGDKILDTSLAKIGDKGLFTKQIEEALLENQIDLAVHSMKDLPTRLDHGLSIGAVLKREDPRDAFISRTGAGLNDLPRGANVATGSLRRRAQLLAYRPDLNLMEIRGNIDTRLKKLAKNENMAALILAKAGLVRIGLNDLITHVIDSDVMLPAVGQGALAVQVRDGDTGIIDLVSILEHQGTRRETTAERALLRVLEGGCHAPIGAFARAKHGKLTLEGVVASIDGNKVFREKVESTPDMAHEAGVNLANTLKEAGAAEVLDQIVKKGF